MKKRLTAILLCIAMLTAFLIPSATALTIEENSKQSEPLCSHEGEHWSTSVAVTGADNSAAAAAIVSVLTDKIEDAKLLIESIDYSKLSDLGVSDKVISKLDSAVELLKGMLIMNVDKDTLLLLLSNYGRAKAEIRSAFTMMLREVMAMKPSELAEYIITEDISDKLMDEALTVDGIIFKDVNVSRLIPSEISNDKTAKLVSLLTMAAIAGVTYNDTPEEDKAAVRASVEDFIIVFLTELLEDMRDDIVDLMDKLDPQMMAALVTKALDSIDSEALIRYITKILDGVSDAGESAAAEVRDTVDRLAVYLKLLIDRLAAAGIEIDGPTVTPTDDGGYIISFALTFEGQEYHMDFMIESKPAEIPATPTEEPTEPVTPTEPVIPTEPVTPTEPAKEPEILGDADGSGTVNVFDVSFILKGVAGAAGYPDYAAIDASSAYFKAADVDCSGTVNVFDAALLVKYTSGDSSAAQYGIGDKLAD